MRNREQQYTRTSINLKLCGVPIQEGEEEVSNTKTNPITKFVIEKVCEAAGIQVPESSIDVCHRLGNDTHSPIIIRFSSKSARFDFYNQKD